MHHGRGDELRGDVGSFVVSKSQGDGRKMNRKAVIIGAIITVLAIILCTILTVYFIIV